MKSVGDTNKGAWGAPIAPPAAGAEPQTLARGTSVERFELPQPQTNFGEF